MMTIGLCGQLVSEQLGLGMFMNAGFRSSSAVSKSRQRARGVYVCACKVSHYGPPRTGSTSHAVREVSNNCVLEFP